MIEVLKERLLKEISDFCNRNTSEWEVSITEQDPYRSAIYSSLCPSTDWTLSISHKNPQNQRNNRMYDISILYAELFITTSFGLMFCKIQGRLGVASLKMDSDLNGLDWEFLDYDCANFLMPEISKIMAIILNFFEPEKKSEIAINELVSEAMNWRQVI
jgi:hypothetical protein